MLTSTYDLKFSSYMSKCTAHAKMHGLLERDCVACLEAQLAIRILHPALTKKIAISDSKVVIQYVER